MWEGFDVEPPDESVAPDEELTMCQILILIDPELLYWNNSDWLSAEEGIAFHSGANNIDEQVKYLP